MTKIRILLMLILALTLAACAPCSAEEEEAAVPAGETAAAQEEEQGLEEIQPLVEMSEVEQTEGMNLEELTSAFSETAMSEYYDSASGFSIQYPSFFLIDDEKEIFCAVTSDKKASLTIEHMPNEGALTETALMEAIKLESPDAKTEKNAQNGCIRADARSGDGSYCETDLYLIAGKHFHHITMTYPAAEQELYEPYIEYMINTIGTNETDQG